MNGPLKLKMTTEEQSGLREAALSPEAFAVMRLIVLPIRPFPTSLPIQSILGSQTNSRSCVCISLRARGQVTPLRYILRLVMNQSQKDSACSGVVMRPVPASWGRERIRDKLSK